LPPPAEEIVPPTAVSLNLSPTLELAAGRGATVTVGVVRHGFDGPVVVRFEDLPRGVAAPAITIPAGASEADASFSARIGAAEGPATVRVVAEAGDGATSAAELALTVGPRPGLEQERLGRSLLASGDAGRALAAFDEALRHDPEAPSAYLGRGSAHLKLGDAEKALADFDRALGLDPDDPVALNNRGLAYRELGELYKAIADYSEAIRLKPDDAVSRYNRGLAYHRLGHEAEAIADLDEALRLDPKLDRARAARDEARSRRKSARPPLPTHQ
jgi:tetratricopeptide (TPR) repeat protein